jgi:hypothetical protein
VIAFIAAGFSETYMAFEVGLLGLALAATLFLRGERSRRLRPLLLASLCGAMLAAAIMAAAPGNAARLHAFTRPGLLADVVEPVFVAGYFLASFAVRAPVLLALLIVVPGFLLARPAGLATAGDASWAFAGRGVMIAGLALVAAAAVPSIVIGGGAPPVYRGVRV